MPDEKTPAEGGTKQGARGAEGATQGAEDTGQGAGEKSLNARAKELPWVRELMQQSARLKAFEEERETAKAEAERKKAESREDYEKALAIEKQKREELQTQHDDERKKLKLDAAFAHAGLKDPRIVSLFSGGYDPEKDAAEYVESIKKAPENAEYFGTAKRAYKPPRGAETSPPDEFDAERDLQSWLQSSDPKKRERAVAHNREKYRRQLKNKR